MKIIKKVIAVLLLVTICMSITATVGTGSIKAAESYPKIPALNISRIYQSNEPAAEGLCYWCSMATVQGYCLGTYTYGGVTSSYRTGGKDYNFVSKGDAISKKLNTYNGYANNSTNLNTFPVKMTLVNSGLGNNTATYQKIYNQLKLGKPVIIYATIPHASVVIGYNGSSTTLDPKGFTVLEVKKDGNYWTNSTNYYSKYANSPQVDKSASGSNMSCYVPLKSWLDKCGTITQICYPTNAVDYTIAYNANGGEGSVASHTVRSGDDFNIAKSGFSRLGYTLSGFNVYRKSDKRWYTSGGWATASEISAGGYTKKHYGLGASYVFNSSWTNGAASGDTYTFYAVWTKNNYTIDINPNGGEGTYTPYNLTLNSTLTVPENPFTKEGYYFAGYYCYRSSDKTWYGYPQGWLTKNEMKNGGYSMKVYSPGDSFNMGSAWINTSASNDTFTFYPIWVPLDIEITFYENHSGANYMSEGIKSSEEVFADNYFSRDASIYTVTRDDSVVLNNQPSIKIVGSAVGADKKDVFFDTDTNKGIDRDGYYAPDAKKMTLSFWAKGTADGAKLYWRWGYTTDYYSVTLSTQWKKYTVDVSKNVYDSDGMYLYFDKAGTFYLNNLCLRDDTNREFYKQETGGYFYEVGYEYGKTYGELPVPVRDGYIFEGWYTGKNSGTEITADSEVLPYNINLYARWEKEFSDLPVKEVFDENGKKYELYNNAVSWEEAKTHCEEKGGHLVTINSSEENDLVLGMIEGNESFSWIGASYNPETSSWNWVTDEPFEYTNWAKNEPSTPASTAEYYVHMFSFDIGVENAAKGTWNDVEGVENFASYYGRPNSMYICEYEPEEVEYDTYMAGDVNQDGTINIFDVFMMARYNAGHIEFTEQQLLIGDTNNDGTINIIDVFMVARYNAGYDVDLNYITIIK